MDDTGATGRNGSAGADASSDSADQAIHQLFVDLFVAWLHDAGPPEAMEASHPELAREFGQSSVEFTFEQFRHERATPGWGWQRMELSGEAEGTLMLYRPVAWSELRQEGLGFQLLTADGKPRQSSFLAAMDWWAPEIPAFLDTVGIVGFDFLPVYPGYGRWVFVTSAAAGYWCWGVYRAKDWVIVMKGDASNGTEIAEQLQALMNGDPWGWWMDRTD